MVEPHNSNFRVITTNALGVRIFRKIRVIKIFASLAKANNLLFVFVKKLNLTSQRTTRKQAKLKMKLHQMKKIKHSGLMMKMQMTSQMKSMNQHFSLIPSYWKREISYQPGNMPFDLKL